MDSLDPNDQGENLNIDFLVSSRKIKRSTLTKLYNNRENFVEYDEIKLNLLKDVKTLGVKSTIYVLKT